MTGEIDRDFYCPEDRDTINNCIDMEERCDLCDGRQRKWPTPEQYKQENQGREYPADWAVYARKNGKWTPHTYLYAATHATLVGFDAIVCACTPWGKPKDNWRPS